MKVKGVGELGMCGVAAAVANAIYNATGVRVRHYPITLDKPRDCMPALRADSNGSPRRFYRRKRRTNGHGVVGRPKRGGATTSAAAKLTCAEPLTGCLAPVENAELKPQSYLLGVSDGEPPRN